MISSLRKGDRFETSIGFVGADLELETEWLRLVLHHAQLFGGTREVMEAIVQSEYDQVGTFNGNPLMAAAARATLTEVLNDDAYRHFDELRARMVEGCERAIARYRLPAHVVAIGAKGCITFAPSPIRDYRAFLGIDDRYSNCHWLFQHNGGVFLPPWGKAEQWMLSVQHTTEDVDLFVGNFTLFARALRS